MNEILLFDTYAILEIINANKNYIPYLESKMVINNFIYAELCHRLFRENVKNSEEYVKGASKHIIHASSDVIKEAMKFRIKHKKKKLSMTDCISYIMSNDLGMKFLTGDKEFKNFPNVEFVK